MKIRGGIAARRSALLWLVIAMSFAANGVCLADNAWGNSRNAWGSRQNAWGSGESAWGSNPNAWGRAPSPKAGNGWPNAGRGKSAATGIVGTMPQAIVDNKSMVVSSIQYHDSGAIRDGLQTARVSQRRYKALTRSARRDRKDERLLPVRY